MSDMYQQFASSGLGRTLVSRLGLPNPVPLRRHTPGQPVISDPVLLGAAPNGRLSDALRQVLTQAKADLHDTASPEERYGALVFDATGITDSTQLRALYDFFHPVLRSVAKCGRLLVLATPPESAGTSREATAQRALEGFTRSLAKEARAGGTAQLIYVAPGAESAIESTVRFFLSAKSAYVSGQVVRINSATVATPADWAKPLDGKVALVTGASRGIGAAIAETLSRDGAHVVCLDIPAQGAELSAVANRVGGSTLQVDITSEDAPRTIADHLRERHEGVDIVVHNAGITKDKKLANMAEGQWDAVLAVNLSSQERVNDVLLNEKVLRDNGRIIGVSSIAGIAGNVGQSNYGTTKAGVIGMVQSLAPTLAEAGGTINAVAPGFIETQMTAAIPLLTREAGRRMNSLAQGGLPIDVAETIAWYANPASTGVNGNVVRVCGQSLIGA